MRVSKLLVQTLRQAPTDIPMPGHQFLLRGSFMRPLAASVYVFLPLGTRVRRRVQAELARALEDAGGQEIGLPILQPLEVAEQRNSTLFPEWVASLQSTALFASEGYRAWGLQSGHERTVLALMRNVVQSYRQLPVLLYLFWQAPEWEVHASRGLFGSRESMVLDAYSLHQNEEERGTLYQLILEEFARLAERSGIPTCRIIMDIDERGCPSGHRLIWPWREGERTFLVCSKCNWACEQTIAPVRKETLPAEPPQPLQEVATPECKTIAALCAWLQIPPSRTAKSLFLVTEGDETTARNVIAVVRGDTELSMSKLRRLLGTANLRPASEEEIRMIGAEPGYGSPIGIRGAEVVVDNLVASSRNLVAGANRPEYHLLNVNYGRDYEATRIADIALAQEGDLCPSCAATLRLEHGIELALAGNLGAHTTQAHNLCYLDQSGAPQPVLLGRYRFHIDRLIASVAETHHDEQGLIWPASLAPYDVYLMTLGRRNPLVDEMADRLYDQLHAANVRVLYDDRDERAGVKFYDADLIGLPLRIAIGERSAAEGSVEVKQRGTSEVTKVVITDVVAYVKSLL